MQYKVIKRDGSVEDFSVAKIKRVITWASEGLRVNSLELESSIANLSNFEEITTETIHSHLIQLARSLCTPEVPDWSFVAGRLETLRLWKKNNTQTIPFLDFFNNQIEKNIYKHPGLKKYNQKDVKKLGTYINLNRDFEHSYASVLSAREKYLMPGENIQQMQMVNAMILASVESNRDKRIDWAVKYYNSLSKRKISLATPWLGNLRADGSVGSCFILSIDDDIDSIFDNYKNIALISKSGGGLGIDLSRIRSLGSPVNGKLNSHQGVTGWVKIINDILVTVNQSFSGDTPIATKSGDLPINQIKIGDEVLTHDGSYKPVEKVFVHKNTDPFVIINGIKMTEHHPVCVLRGAKGKSKQECVQMLKDKLYKWISAKDVNINDLIIKY